MKRRRNISPEVIHADGDIIVVNKPAGVIVHRAPGYPDGTLRPKSEITREELAMLLYRLYLTE